MEIRRERPEDIEAIRQITKATFEPLEHGSRTEAAIVDALRDADALRLSLVADAEGEVVGHAAFSPVAIESAEMGWYGLGPVSVRPDRQNEGIGSALIRDGLDRLAQAGASGCVVLGEPDYYRRFGFENDPDLRYDGAPSRYFMQFRLDGPAPSGSVTYHAAFGAPSA